MARVIELGLVDGRLDGAKEALSAIERVDDEVEVHWLDHSQLAAPGADAADLADLSHGASIVRRGDDSYVALAPIRNGEALLGAVSVRESLASRDAYVQRALTTNGVTLVVVLVLCGASSLVLGRWLVGARVDRLVARARIIAGGNELPAEPVTGRDELSMLEHEQNLMARELEHRRERAQLEAEARLKAEQQLRHADRLTTVGQLAAGMAHELGTPLNVISGRAALIVSRGSGEQDVSDAGIVRDQAARITRIVQRMLDFSRRSRPARARTDVCAVVSDTVELLEATARKAGVRVVQDLTRTPVSAWIDAGQIQQVLTNLLMNGIQAMPDGGRLEVSVVQLGAAEDQQDRHLQIVVADSGVGMQPDVAARIFDPFFTTKEPGEGTGLGLSVVHGIIVDHDGTVTVEDIADGGTAFIVDLPTGEPS